MCNSFPILLPVFVYSRFVDSATPGNRQRRQPSRFRLSWRIRVLPASDWLHTVLCLCFRRRTSWVLHWRTYVQVLIEIKVRNNNYFNAFFYSHELQTCDWPRNVGCDAGNGDAGTISTIRVTDPRTKSPPQQRNQNNQGRVSQREEAQRQRQSQDIAQVRLFIIRVVWRLIWDIFFSNNNNSKLRMRMN